MLAVIIAKFVGALVMSGTVGTTFVGTKTGTVAGALELIGVEKETSVVDEEVAVVLLVVVSIILVVSFIVVVYFIVVVAVIEVVEAIVVIGPPLLVSFDVFEDPKKNTI